MFTWIFDEYREGEIPRCLPRGISLTAKQLISNQKQPRNDNYEDNSTLDKN